MQLHHYHPVTQEYLYSDNAEPDPMSLLVCKLAEQEVPLATVAGILKTTPSAIKDIYESKQATFLVPNYATEVPPLVPLQNKAIVWGGSSWSYVDDYRGTKVTAEDSSGRFYIIDRLGVSEKDIVFTPMPATARAEYAAEEEIIKLRNALSILANHLVNPSESSGELVMNVLKEFSGGSDADTGL